MRTQVGRAISRGHYRWQESDKWKFPLLFGIVVLAFGVRIMVALVTTSWIFPSDRIHWEFGYEMGRVAASLANGNGFSWPEWNSPQGPTAWMPPVYPLIMAAAFKIFGIYSEPAAMAIELFQALISALTCVVLYALGKRLYHAQAGLVAAGLFALYPPAIYYAVGMIWGTSLFTCFLLIVILMFLYLADHPHVKGGIGLGFLMGFTALVDPIIVSTYPFACIWLSLRAKGDWRTVTRTIAAVLIVFGVTISPWIARNYVTFGRFIFIKSTLGTVLSMGNNEYSTGDYRDGLGAYGNNTKRIFTEAEQGFLKQADEGTRESFLFWKGISFIMEHPFRFVKLTVKRFVLYWTHMRPLETWQGKVSQIAYFLVLALAVVDLFLRRAKGRDVQLVLLILLLLPLPYYVTIVGIFRYRFPIEPILIVFAGYTIYWMMSLFRETAFRMIR